MNARLQTNQQRVSGGNQTFDSGFEVWVFVELVHLLLPVKLMSPVGNNGLQIGGIEAILEVAVF